MLAPYLDFLFVGAHFTMLLARLSRTNSYGPGAIVFVAFFDVFFALPVYLDFFFGAPAYERFGGISAALSSATVQALYNAIILTLGAIFAWFLRQPSTAAVSRTYLTWWRSLVLLAVTYLPLAYVALSGNSQLYQEYGAVISNDQLQASAFHNIVGFLASLSVVALGLLSITAPAAGSKMLLVLAALPATAADVWLVGKRSIIAFLLLIVGLIVLDRHRHAIKLRHGLLGVGMVGGLLAFSWLYQSALRPDTQLDTAAAYETLRLDLGRDHGLKLAIYNEVNESATPTLEYRMQSFLFIATIAIPRSWWPDKPWPYAVYATSAALDSPLRDWGWGLTTDLLSESIANMGLIGLLPCCLFFTWGIRRVDRSTDPLILLLGTLSLSSLLVLQFAAVSVWHVALICYWLAKNVFRAVGASRTPPPTTASGYDIGYQHRPGA